MTVYFKCLLLLLFASASLCMAQEIYKTVSPDGNVAYTDKPTGPNSVKVEVAEPIVVPPVIPAPQKSKPEPPQTPASYEVTLVYPTPELHINPGTFHLPIQVITDPGLDPQHKLVILDNGEPVQGAVIEYIIRGSHVIEAQVVDQKGKVLGSSEPVNVYVHRPTVNSRRNIEERQRRSSSTSN